MMTTSQMKYTMQCHAWHAFLLFNASMLDTVHVQPFHAVRQHVSLMGDPGGGQGIGRAVAHGLGEAGASVAIVDINAQKAQETAAELRFKGIRSIAIQADVRSKKESERCDSLLHSNSPFCSGPLCINRPLISCPVDCSVSIG